MQDQHPDYYWLPVVPCLPRQSHASCSANTQMTKGGVDRQHRFVMESNMNSAYDYATSNWKRSIFKVLLVLFVVVEVVDHHHEKLSV